MLNRIMLQAASFVITSFPANCVVQNWLDFLKILGHLLRASNMAATDTS